MTWKKLTKYISRLTDNNLNNNKKMANASTALATLC